jgi:hypothetical protein
VSPEVDMPVLLEGPYVITSVDDKKEMYLEVIVLSASVHVWCSLIAKIREKKPCFLRFEILTVVFQRIESSRMLHHVVG